MGAENVPDNKEEPKRVIPANVFSAMSQGVKVVPVETIPSKTDDPKYETDEPLYYGD